MYKQENWSMEWYEAKPSKIFMHSGMHKKAALVKQKGDWLCFNGKTHIAKADFFEVVAYSWSFQIRDLDRLED